MSNMYTLDMVLNTQLQEQSVKKILQRATTIGCRYMQDSDYDKATDYVMNEWCEGKRKNKSHCSPEIPMDFEGVSFDLKLGERSGLLAPWLWLNRFGWNKKNVYRRYDDDIDFEKYIRLFLLLVQDFKVVWIKTYEELGELDLYDGYEWSRPRLRDHAILTIPPKFRVDVTMEIPYNHETIHNLLRHGECAGWKFSHVDSLNAQQAADAILKQSPTGNGEAHLTCFVGNATYQLSFTLRFKAFFMFTLTPLHAASVHLDQTVVHALELCTDFVIFELNTFDARYNYIQSYGDEVK